MTDTGTYLGDQLLNWLKGDDIDPAPADVYFSLWNGDPEGAGVEITGTIGLTRTVIAFTAVASRAIENAALLDFGLSSGSGSVTYIAITDDAVAGNVIQKKAIPATAIAINQTVRISAGNLSVSY